LAAIVSGIDQKNEQTVAEKYESKLQKFVGVSEETIPQ
jgi:hypothetical protein